MKNGEPGELLRVYLHESDRDGAKPLYHVIVEAARTAGMAGATVLKSPLGFGHGKSIHTSGFVEAGGEMSILIDIIDTRQRIEAFLPQLMALLAPSANPLITREQVEIIRISTDRHDPPADKKNQAAEEKQ